MPVPIAGEVLVKTLYVSVDPYMRGRINVAKSYGENIIEGFERIPEAFLGLFGGDNLG